jgi:flagellar basal-body rod protein FlgB
MGRPAVPTAPSAVLIDSTQLALHRAMQGAGLRQEALASNLANANTPGYQRRDVNFHDALLGAMGSADRSAALQDVQLVERTDASGAVRADGNTVDVDAESAKMAANGLEYEQLASAARVRIDILKIAMGVQ